MHKNQFGQIDIRSLMPAELSDVLEENGIEKYRAKQIFRWLYRHVDSFEGMTDIPRKYLPKLNEIFYIDTLSVASVLTSKTDDTKKYLFTLQDGHAVESVSMKYEHGNSICVSSQVGCRMGCAFCASTKAGFVRNLLPSEILLQLEYVTRDRQKTDPNYRISNVVIMGIGEPLDNFDNIVRFLHLLNEKDGFGIGYRHISLSTCGLVPGIERLAQEKLPITLSISLHAPDDETRARIMPINRKYDVKTLIGACKKYIQQTTRRISFEYALIHGINDRVSDAQNLAKLLSGMLCHVNLIRINPIREQSFSPSPPQDLAKFVQTLEKHHINVTVRRRLGLDIDAACGQLRKSHMQK